MQRFSAETLLALWETARLQHALDRALTILLAATPGATREELADLSIGERDARLLELRILVLGSQAEGFAECPQCGERIEFPLDTAAFRPLPEGRASARPLDGLASHEIVSNGTTVRFRLPTSRDLAEVVASPNSQQALAQLIARCLSPNEKKLSAQTLEEISRAMLEADPQAEIRLDLACPGCGHRSELLFDVADFFWKELVARAQSLLREIDTLARAYGWTEREILNLPAARRQTYLELVTG